MSLLTTLKPRASKKTIVTIGALIWMMAGYRVFSLGYQDITHSPRHVFASMVIAVSIFAVFYNKIFSKMVDKHSKRLMAKETEKPCLFSFFDRKGYMMMAIMMTLGIGLRQLHIIQGAYLGAFYIGIGLALFITGILFFKARRTVENKIVQTEMVNS